MTGRNVRWRVATALALVVATAAAVLPACAPTPAPSPPAPTDIAFMTDGQLDQALQSLLPRVEAGYADPAVLAAIPPARRAAVDQLVSELRTSSGRASLGARLRQTAAATRRGLPQRPAVVPAGLSPTASGTARDTIAAVPPPTATRSPAPATGTGVSVPVTSLSGSCRAPDGPGTIPLPVGAVGGQLLTPRHDVFARTNPSTSPVLGAAGPISPTGQGAEPGGDPGIELRQIAAYGQQVKVRIHMEDPKGRGGFGVAGLYPIISLRPIGGDASSEVRAAITDGHVYCYQDDTSPDAFTRGYFEGWVTIPRVAPGFQLIAEVVDNDAYFKQNADPGCTFFCLPRDVLLSADGPQYWAGADRATVHIGAPAVTSASPIPRSVGAFASATSTAGDGTPNVLTDTNNQPTDDIQGALEGAITGVVQDKVAQALSSDVLQAYALTVQAFPSDAGLPTSVSTSVRFSTPDDGTAPVPDENPTYSGAVRADVDAATTADLYVQILGVPCFSLGTGVKVRASLNVWADSHGNDAQLVARQSKKVQVETFPFSNDPVESAFNPVCWTAFLAASTIAGHFIEGAINSGIDSAFGFAVTDACADRDTAYQQANPDLCLKPGAVQKLLEKYRLNDVLPTLDLSPVAGGLGVKPVVNNLDNAWCRGLAQGAACSPDGDLFSRRGLEVVGDVGLPTNPLPDAAFLPFGGRFRNVYAPPLYGTIEQLIATHRDPTGNVAGLGLAVDPRQVNVLMRHLTQGGSSSTVTAGLLDQGPITVPVVGWTLSTRPEVAPFVLGGPDPSPVLTTGDGVSAVPQPSQSTLPVVLPDLRLEVTTAPGTPPIRYSVSTSANVTLGSDPVTGGLKVSSSIPQVDIQTVGGCQVDYTQNYAASYLACGRGSGGTGGRGISTLNDLLAAVAGLVASFVDQSVGSIGLPNLTGVVPGLDAALTNVRFAQSGGYLTVYADLKPAPRVAISYSPNLPGETPSMRFFPGALVNIDPLKPTVYRWEVRDDARDAVVGTTDIPAAAAVRAALDQFDPVTTAVGTERRARVTLKVFQPDEQNPRLFASTTGVFHRYESTPPPPTPCNGGPTYYVNTSTPVSVPC